MMKLKYGIFILLTLGIFIMTNLLQIGYSLTNIATDNATETAINYSMVGEEDNNNSSNNNSSSNAEPCNMPPCQPGKACIQVCPNSGPQ